MAAFTIPTETPESDGTLEWDRTTIVVVRPEAGGISGVGYAYADENAARLIHETLRPRLLGLSAFDVSGCWLAMVLEAPMPPEVSFEQAKNFALSLARGEPDRGAILESAVAERVRELV